MFLTLLSRQHLMEPAAGGFAGATVWMALRYGVARGVFSNEAGLGSSPIAHAAANTNNPVKQGMISMLEPLIDTLIVCTITAFVILLSNQWIGELNGAVLTASSFEYLFENGKYIVIFGLILFSFAQSLVGVIMVKNVLNFFLAREL